MSTGCSATTAGSVGAEPPTRRAAAEDLAEHIGVRLVLPDGVGLGHRAEHGLVHRRAHQLDLTALDQRADPLQPLGVALLQVGDQLAGEHQSDAHARRVVDGSEHGLEAVRPRALTLGDGTADGQVQVDEEDEVE